MSYILLPGDEKQLEQGGYGQQIRNILANCPEADVVVTINGGEIAGIACNARVDLRAVRAFAWRVARDQQAAQPASD